MNQTPLSQDDPRLTAYALDEMAPAERVEFEQLLRHDAAAQKAVDEIRAAGSLLAAALEHEPVGAEFTPGQPGAAKRGVLLRFPQLYYTLSGLAAACFAVFFVLWQRNEPAAAPKQYAEVSLTPPSAAANEVEAKKAEADSAVREGLVAAVKNDYKREQEARARQTVSLDMPLAANVMPPPQAPSIMADVGAASTASYFKFNAASDQPAAAQGSDKSKDARTWGDAGAPVAAAPATRQLSAAAGSYATLGGKETQRLDETLQLSTFAVTAASSAGYISGQVTGGGDRAQAIAAKRRAEPAANTEAYSFRQDNDYLRVADQPLSTFSIDVDTASYANVRRFLQQGRLPPPDAVRIEELVNYFPYHYAPPAGNVPFAVALESASAPWNPAHRLVRIGLKGREVADSQRPPANLVFLLDVSGSMNEPNKLPLVKQSLRLLVNRLRADDRVAIAVYAGASGMALPSTTAAHKAEILDAIDRLEASGSTNGAMGIQLAYDLAKANFVTGGVNRVILATDGDFNVGLTNEGDLVRLVQEKAKSGVFLSVLGFGMGNIKDGTLEQLADKGNGNYAYIDSLAEARKALVEQAGGTLMTIAKDVKLQVEFNPRAVQAYRLIGYENRVLAKEDFNNDQVDAGDIGAGHTVTALYEIVPVGAEMPATGTVDALKYQAVSQGKAESRKLTADSSPEMLTVKIRYKEPAGEVSSKLEFPLRDGGAAFASATADFKFAAAVAAFGMVLRDSPHKGTSTLADVAAWGREGLEDDAGGYRAEFLSLVERAQSVVQ